MLVLEAFRVHALYDPGNIIMTSAAGDAMTYREAWNVSEMLGAHLIERTERGELPPGCPVTVLGHAHPLLLACCLACTKSGHAFELLDDADFAVAADRRLVLTASEVISPRQLEALGVAFLDAHKIRGYIVPGMTDDFSCGCGIDDCIHGPFLQECDPAEQLGEDGVFSVSAKEMTVAEHEELLGELFEKLAETGAGEADGEQVRFSPPIDLSNPQLAAVVAMGGEVLLG